MAVGGVAVFPADTVYGLACDPESPEAVARLYGLKRRAMHKPSAGMFFDAGPAHAGAARAAAARGCDAPAAEPRPPLPARLRGGPGDARPARAGRHAARRGHVARAPVL